jgi:hypothetical protein
VAVPHCFVHASTGTRSCHLLYPLFLGLAILDSDQLQIDSSEDTRVSLDPCSSYVAMWVSARGLLPRFPAIFKLLPHRQRDSHTGLEPVPACSEHPQTLGHLRTTASGIGLAEWAGEAGLPSGGILHSSRYGMQILIFT